MEYDVRVDAGAVCEGLVNDLSGYVCEYDEWVIFRECWDVDYGGG